MVDTAQILEEGKIAYLGGIMDARFREKVFPGSMLKLEPTVIKKMGNICICEGFATVNDKIVCEALLSLAIGD